MKVLINSSLRNNENEEENTKKIKGILLNNTIKYNEEGVKVEIVLDDIITLSRINNEYEIRLTFDNKKITNGSYIIKDINKKIDFKITTNQLKLENNQLLISYKLDINDLEFYFKLDYEVIT